MPVPMKSSTNATERMMATECWLLVVAGDFVCGTDVAVPPELRKPTQVVWAESDRGAQKVCYIC